MKTLNLFLLILISFQINYSQAESLDLKLISVKVNNEIVVPSQNKFQILKSDSIAVHYKAVSKQKKEIFYRIFVDAKLTEPKILDTIFVFKNMILGAHIIKIVAYNEKGSESQALLIPVEVIEKPTVSEKTPEQLSAQRSFDFQPYIVPSLIGIVVLQFLVIIFISVKKKSNGVKYKQNKEELAELKYSYKRAKEELAKQHEVNENLRKQIKELDENVKTLEKTNVKLVEQKEKLAESKARLEYLHSQKEEMFAIAIHDIKNPASAIKGYIELLNSYELNANEQQEIMESLVASSDDIVKLSQQMCAIIAKAMPEPKLKFVEYSIEQIIESVYNQNTSYAKAKKVKLYNKSSIDLPKVKIDPEKIEEALDNLVNNAIKYAPPETIVEIKSYVKEGAKRMVVVEVKDNGYGLSEDDLKKSFQKGAVLSNKPTGLEQSSGLGLWIVKRIIDEHNGKVWVESKLSVGSTFAFELPFE
ncbi:MAG: hypothetical protein HZA74_04815 [Ignavibacteriales bacterium]|nr:hypothetical protein [Ignavibacteriales bacterium]